MNDQRFDPRRISWKIIRGSLKAVDPETAVRSYFAAHPDVLAKIESTPGRIFVVGAGKAGSPMAASISDIFGEKISAGLVIVKYGHTGGTSFDFSKRIRIIEAGHPVPDEVGLAAAREIETLLSGVTKDDTVLCLISGGGSALLTLPVSGLTLSDLQATTGALLAAGATINQFNTVRKHLSAIKGGGLARLAAPARVCSLILSDVVGDPLEVIASGPTVPDPTTFADTWDIIEQFQLHDRLPISVVQHLRQGCEGGLPDTPGAGDAVFNRVSNAIIGSNRIAARAAVEAARAEGLNALLLTTFIEGEAREVGRFVAGLAKGLASDEGAVRRPACLIAGGETTVTVRGDGQGGRNQEMALAIAVALAGWSNTLVVCLATDGNDGPTDAAGAFADGATISRAQALGLDSVKYLQHNDAYNFFAPLNDLIMTGPTNTNVNDLIFIFAW
jgi:hydroxypyruvate reductase